MTTDTTTICGCGQPTRDHRHTCDTCLDHLTQALGDVTWLDEELTTSLARQKGVDYRTSTKNHGGRKPAETPTPVNWGASEAHANLTSILAAWVRYCYDENVPHQSPNHELPNPNQPNLLTHLSRWLLWRVDQLTYRDIAPDAVAEILKAVGHARRVIDRPPDSVYAGTCSVDNGGEPCPADLYAQPGAREITCRLCGHTWDVDARRTILLEAAEEHLATATEISRAVSWLGAEPLTADRVRQWAARDRLSVKGHDRSGRPLYRVGDAIDLLASQTRLA